MHKKLGIDNFHLVRLIEHFKLEDNEELAELNAQIKKRKDEREEMEVKRATPSNEFLQKLKNEINDNDF